MSSSQLTTGQSFTATITIENQSVTDVDSVRVDSLAVTVPSVASLEGPPTPTFVDIPAGEQRQFTVQLGADQPGSAALRARVSTASGSLSGLLTTGPTFAVEQAPTSMVVSALSNLPVSVNRGQDGVTPLSWQLEHGDQDTTVAALEVRALTIEICDAFGTTQSAASALPATPRAFPFRSGSRSRPRPRASASGSRPWTPRTRSTPTAKPRSP